MPEKQTVLFVCTHNSSRSQMAEGLLNHYWGDSLSGLSAGTEPGGVNPFAVKAMAEMGVDISHHTSDSVDSFADTSLDFVITVCDHAKEHCPYVPAQIRNLHMGFPDPTRIQGTDEEKLAGFIDVRDQISAWLTQWAAEQGLN